MLTKSPHSTRTSFSKAQLTAKANLDRAQREESALLLASLAAPPSMSDSTSSLPPRRKQNLSSSTELTNEDKTVNAASDVTTALRHTHTLMQTELSRSQFAHDTLKESTAALAELGETYSTLDTMLSSSRNLLGTLLKSQKSDTWYLESAFYLLVATIGWLIFRRFVYGPAWWFLYLPLKMFYKAWMGVFVAVGLRSSRDGVFASEGEVTGTVAQMVGSGTATVSLSGSDAPVVRTGSEGSKEEDGMIEEVGKIIDDSQEQGSEQGTEYVESPPNPKKRMWEEGQEAKEEQQQKRDEL
jgi:protein transport protein SEC20